LLQVYPSHPHERADIERITHAAGNFHAAELATPVELFDGYLRDPKVSGYNFLSAQRDGRVVGYACYGPTALTEGTYDLYWIVAEASAHGAGRQSTSLLGDEISPDTCRFWEQGTKRKLDKDRFRRDLGDVEAAYQEMLNRVIGAPAAR
jgi:phosphoribosylaminoimidazole-succinocarboxamide synthase